MKDQYPKLREFRDAQGTLHVFFAGWDAWGDFDLLLKSIDALDAGECFDQLEGPDTRVHRFHLDNHELTVRYRGELGNSVSSDPEDIEWLLSVARKLVRNW